MYLFPYRGSGESGHLGHGDDNHVRTPKLVSALSKEMVIHVAVGNEHTLALTETGELYGWGRNTGGEVVSSREPVATPTIIEGVSSITYVSCGPSEVSMCACVRG